MDDNSKEVSIKEKRIREITLAYYSIAEVKKAIFKFSENRECIPRYFEGFGKRPDNFQYESDILEQVRKGATSFHSSEELWKDPLELSTEQSEKESNELRIGWDLLLDVDSPYLEYSKIYAQLIIEALEFHGVKNVSVKFSGSKGFHIIVPWKAFPRQIYGQETRKMFPDWPKLICQYLTSFIQPKLSEKIFEQDSLKELAKKTGKKEEELLITECLNCHRPAIKRELVTWVCPYCKNEVVMVRKNKGIPKCPNENCRKIMTEKYSKEIYFCEFCNKDSNKFPQLFAKTREKTEKLIDADLVLVAPRHLFRMPYSLHEKTALSSIVIDKDKIKDFQLTDARPLKVQVKNFYPDAKENEAKNLLLQALDWKEQRDKNSILSGDTSRKPRGASDKNYKEVQIQNLTEDLCPPCIRLILKGVKEDGRKRALFILMNFFKSLKLSDEEIREKIKSWNEKNYNPLKQGYIQSQFQWYKKNQARLPPNCDKPLYAELAVCHPDEICRQIKNPINYVFKRYFRERKGFDKK